MTIYEIDQKIMEAFDAAIDPDTGEIVDQEAYAAFLRLDMERDVKIENTALWVKDLKAEAEAIRAEEVSLAVRRKAKENKAESLKRFLGGVIGENKYESARVRVGWRKSTTVEAELSKIPEQYLRYKDPEADKKKLAADLKAGKEIPGAVLIEKQNLQIR